MIYYGNSKLKKNYKSSKCPQLSYTPTGVKSTGIEIGQGNVSHQIMGVVYFFTGDWKLEIPMPKKIVLHLQSQEMNSPYLSNTVPLVVVGVATSPSEVPLPWLRLGLQTLFTEAEEKSSGGSSGQPNCSLVLP